MGKRGPKPKPTSLRVFEGNPGKKPVDTREPSPESAAKIPAPPEWLPDGAKAKWAELAPILHPLGLLTQSDIDVLATYCRAWDEFTRLDVECRGNETVMTDKGNIIQNPLVGVRNKAFEQMRKDREQLGIGAANRVGLVTDVATVDDDLDAMRKKKSS